MTDVASAQVTVTSGTEGTMDEEGIENIPSPFASFPVLTSDSPAATIAATVAAASRPLVALDADLGPLQDGEHRVDLPDGVVYFGEVKGGRLEGRGLILFPGGARYEGAVSAGRAQGPGVYVGSEAEGIFYGTWDKGRMHGEIVHTRTHPNTLTICEYEHGVLVRQDLIEVEGKHFKLKGARKAKRRAKEQYKPPKPGEPVYRGHRSFDLVQQLQLGLTYSIAQSQNTGRAGTRSDLDKEEITKQHIPATGAVPGFTWKDYLPCMFKGLREAFGIDNRDYLLSMTGGEALRLLPSPGKSGSIFLMSEDDRFLAKTVRKEEMRLILHLVPAYFEHVTKLRHTLLVRFYGVHRVSPLLGRRVRFLIMENAMPSHLRLHRRFDLKGSTYGRTAGERRYTEPFVTLKDLDVDVKFVLPAATHAAVMAQLAADCALLESLNVMDYSLLLGVHFVGWGNAHWMPPFGNWGCSAGSAPSAPVPPDTSWGAPRDAAVGLAAALQSARLAATASGAAGNEALRSAASIVSRVGRNSVAAWQSAVRLSLHDDARLPDQQVQQVLSRQLSVVEEVCIPIRSATGTRSHSLLTRMQSLAAAAAGAGAPGAFSAGENAAGSRNESDAAGAAAGTATESMSPAPLAGSGATPLPGRSRFSLNSGATPRTSVLPRVMDGEQDGESLRSLGTGVPALAVQIAGEGAAGARPQPVLLYFTIIDFLQEYNLRKRIEHLAKSQIHRGEEISVVSAPAYARRFMDMIGELFMSGPSLKA